jgi:hypothetical protein
VRRQLEAYGICWTNLVRHDARYPRKEFLWERTVAGYNDTDDGVRRIIAAVDKADPRPLWYSDWGTDHGGATNNLRRALDRIRAERGAQGYAAFKSRLRLASADAFGEHTAEVEPPFPLWVNTFQPEINGRRWYHRFSAITARAGGFDLRRDVLTGHGPLGALYPTNTTFWQKEGDTMTFLYLVPAGLNDPAHPDWGSWAGRYGRNPNYPNCNYYWANQADGWNGSTNRDNTLARFAEALQNDFRARLDWCVRAQGAANHPPNVSIDGSRERTVRPGAEVMLDASASTDPDGGALSCEWWFYPEAGTWKGPVRIANASGRKAVVTVPDGAAGCEIHIVLSVRDNGAPALTRYGRVVLKVE